MYHVFSKLNFLLTGKLLGMIFVTCLCNCCVLSAESLFQLLLEITVRSTGMNDSTGQSLTALSCACLFSLVAAWGETGRTLQAISAILTNNGSHACQTIQVLH